MTSSCDAMALLPTPILASGRIAWSLFPKESQSISGRLGRDHLEGRGMAGDRPIVVQTSTNFALRKGEAVNRMSKEARKL